MAAALLAITAAAPWFVSRSGGEPAPLLNRPAIRPLPFPEGYRLIRAASSPRPSPPSPCLSPRVRMRQIADIP